MTKDLSKASIGIGDDVSISVEDGKLYVTEFHKSGFVYRKIRLGPATSEKFISLRHCLQTLAIYSTQEPE